MKFIVLIYIVCFYCECFGQIAELSTSVRYQIEHTDTFKYIATNINKFISKINLNTEQKKLTAQHITKQISNEIDNVYSTLPEEVFYKKSSSAFSTIDNRVFSLEKYSTPLEFDFYKDSIIHLISSKQKKDENDELIYDEFGDPIFMNIAENRPLIDFPFEIISLENWSYSTNNFTKDDLTYVINYSDSISKNHLLTIKTNDKKSPLKIFKNNIKYNFYYSHQKSNPSVNEKLLYEKLTHKYTGINLETFYRFTGQIVSDIINSKVKIYNLNGTELLLNSNISNSFSMPTVVNYSNDSTTISVVSVPYQIQDIVGYQFTEDWYITENKFHFIKKVKSISFLVKDYGKNGELLSTPKLLPFKIKFNN